MYLRLTLACCLSSLLPASAAMAQALDTAAAMPGLQQRLALEASRDLPSRGMPMRLVRLRYGVPQGELAARGGHGARQPVIHRWVYPGYIVYFERGRVIHSVATASGDGFSAPSD